MSIKILSDDLINKIAAGEVLETTIISCKGACGK